jgi:resuscitation-promoting factor RpfB
VRPPARPPAAGGLVVATLILALAAGGAAYFQLEKHLTLVVDGTPQPVRTFGGTVADLLKAEGLPLDHHDEVHPGPGASLSDGMEIEVLLAKQITLLLNGEERVMWITEGKTVADVLDLINVRTGGNAYLEPPPGSPLDDGDTIVFREPISIRLTVDGLTRDVITNAARVGDVLDSLGVIIGRRDRVAPRVGTQLADGMHLRVVRVGVRRARAEEPIPFDVDVRSSDSMYQGQERVIREGRPGLRRNVYRVRTEDGKVASRRLVSTRVVRRPLTRIVVRGTRPATYQFGEASWYHRDGMVAAHPSLPFGTRVTVTNLANGRKVTVIINDRGPFGGRIIDLSDDAFAQLAHLGTGVIDVRLYW